MKEMNKEIFRQNMLMAISEVLVSQSFNEEDLKIAIKPVHEEGKPLLAKDDIMRLILLSDKNIKDRRLNVKQAVDLLASFEPFVPIWINVSLERIEEGKIYISDANGGQGDGSIYRCVSGSTTVAVKISENPYAVAQTKTNGVYLDTTNGTLTAKADKAATDAFGTVKINTASTNNVKLTVTDGVIAASAGLANAAAAFIRKFKENFLG